jgi:uncharacterized protein
MKYRKFGSLDWEASLLGFGAMRFPVIDGDSSKIDEEKATAMIRHAIDNGVNYVDTAYPYHGGNSEPVVGRILQDGYREKVRLATKMPSWLIKEAADFDRYLDEQLERLQTDTIDFYLLHALSAGHWPPLRDNDVFKWAEKALSDGRIQHLGFSFHDKYELFEELIDATDLWTFCQIQYNYMDIEEQAGTKGLKYAASKGLAVVIMEGLLGGRLAKAPASVQKIWDSTPVERKPVDWALRWLWDQPEVSLVLSGMTEMSQLEENLVIADSAEIGCLTVEDHARIAMVTEEYRRLSPIPCTKCEYCLPCPEGVDIPGNIDVFNNGVMYESFKEMGQIYTLYVNDDAKADNCIACRECEDKCPQSIPISEWMPYIHSTLTGEMVYDGRLLP